MGTIVRYEACPRCRENSRDKSGDNLAVYSNDGGKFCFSCGYVLRSKDGTHPDEDYSKQEKLLEEITNQITPEQNAALKEITTAKVDYRCIRKDTAAYFGVRYEIDQETGEPSKQYYPVTKGGELCGYKLRVLPKTFGAPIGYCGKQADFFGQFRFQKGGRDILLVGGEIDCLSAFQMLRDSQLARGKGDYEPIAVISSVVGESGTVSQARLQYQFLNKFNRIILALDNDEAGREASEKLIKVLPKGKCYTMHLRKKDANEYLQAGLEKEFVKDFYDCEQHVPAGIVSSSTLYEKVLEGASVPKIPLPPFLKKMENMMAGGIPIKTITALAASTGVSKTTFMNELIRFWILNSPYKVGIISCELDSAQYGEALLSRHIQNKIALIRDPAEKMAFLKSQAVVDAATELFKREDGSERFSLVDDRDGTLEQIKKITEELIVSCGCSLIVYDPVQDLIGHLSNEEQGLFMNWLKGLLKTYSISIFLVNHTRKLEQSATSGLVMPTENDIHGSSSIMKSSHCNILMARDKHAEDAIERNTTYLRIDKLRWSGNTGDAGRLIYSNELHTMYDFDDYMKEHGVGDF